MELTPQTTPSERSRPLKYTWEDFVALPDDDKRELIDGELIEVEVPNKLHEHIVARLTYSLTAWVENKGAGLVLVSGYKIRVSDERGVMPDLQYFRPENPTAQSADDDEGARPDLAVEVISPSSRRYDQSTKLQWYTDIGVPEYWLLDPEAHTLQRFVLIEGHYSVAVALKDDAVFRPESFPGLEIPLSRLWNIGPVVKPEPGKA